MSHRRVGAKRDFDHVQGGAARCSDRSPLMKDVRQHVVVILLCREVGGAWRGRASICMCMRVTTYMLSDASRSRSSQQQM